MTFRGVEVLQSVDKILAEDTRTSGKLLQYFDIKTPCESYHMHNEHKRVGSLIDRMKKGEVFAIITDAGTPGISDPGFLLVRELLKQDLKVEALPGATSFVPALLKSGFATDQFVFEGFLPHKKGRQTRLNQIAQESRTVILFESTHRIQKLLTQLSDILEPAREVSVSRELTKKFEETINGTPSSLFDYFEAHSHKGEFVVTIEGSKK